MRAILVFLIAAAITTGLYVAVATLAPQTLAPINSWIQTAPTKIANGWSWLQATLGAFGLGMGTMLTAGGSLTFLALSRLWPKAKENIQVEANQKLESVKSSLTQKLGVANSEKEDLEKQLQQKTTELTTLKNSQLDVSQLTEQLAKEKSQLKKLRQDYNTMETTYQNIIADLKMKEKVVIK